MVPNSGRSARKPRKTPSGELLARLARVEAVVNDLKLRGQQEGDDESAPPFPSESDEIELFRQWRKVSNNRSCRPNDDSGGQRPIPGAGVAGQARQGSSVRGDSQGTPVAHRPGRLLHDERGSRYVNNCFWASLAQEVRTVGARLRSGS